MIPRTLSSHTWLLSSKFSLQSILWVSAICQSYMNFILFAHHCEVKYKLRSPLLFHIFLNSLGFISSSINPPQETNLLHIISSFQKSLTMILQYSTMKKFLDLSILSHSWKLKHIPEKVEKLGTSTHNWPHQVTTVF